MKRIKLLLILFLVPYIISAQTSGYKNEPNAPATVTYKRKEKPASSDPAKTNTAKKTTPNTTTPKPSVSSPAPTSTKASDKSQKPQPQSEKLDTIIKMGGKKLACTVKKINPTSVQYVKPDNPALQLEMLRKDIERIHFRNGRKEIFNKPVFSMIDKTQWQAVMVTENEADVDGLYKIGVVKATASSGSRSPKAAKMSATIRLQKKTANIGALIVLVVRSEMKGGYGEIPGWELEGIAYSDTPPADTASVNAAIRKMIERNKARVQTAKNKK